MTKKYPLKRLSSKQLLSNHKEVRRKAGQTMPLFLVGLAAVILGAIFHKDCAIKMGSLCVLIDIVNYAYWTIKAYKIEQILFSRKGKKNGKTK